MTATELKINALVLIEIGSPEEKEEGRQTLQMLRDGLIPTRTLEDTVDELLGELGMSAGHTSAQAVRETLIQAYQSPRLMDCCGRWLYPAVGEALNIPPERVSKCITHGIEAMYRRGDNGKLNEFFRGCLSVGTGMPTPVGFLRRCLKELRERFEITCST